MSTNDARIIALDAATGAPCAGFGEKGEVKIDVGKALLWPGEMQITSPPVVSRGLVVVGSSIDDNLRVDARSAWCAPSMREPAPRAGASIPWFTMASALAPPMSGRRCRR